MYRFKFLGYASILLSIYGCGGAQWEKQLVSGSNGPAYEIRMTRPSAAAQTHAVPQQILTQADNQARHAKLQEQLIRHTALLPPHDFKDYRVGPEDLLQISFLDIDRLSTEARVNGQGQIRLLLVGEVHVAGLSPAEIAKKLSDLYRREDYLKNPQITVSVKDFRYQRVAVTGAVNKPDYYSLIGPRTLLEVLGMAGGLSDKAGEVVNVIRPQNSVPAAFDAGKDPLGEGAEITMVDLNRLLLKGATDRNLTIQNGDVIFVPFALTAYVMGAVTKPGGVLLKENMTVTKAISHSGGLNLVLASNNATIVRNDESGRRVTIPVDLSQITNGRAEDLPLQENDIVFVHESGARRFFFDIKTFLPGGGLSAIPGLM